jgi:hypothetical protein
MLPYRNTRIATIAAGMFFLALALYALFASRNILWGPAIYLSGGSEYVQSSQPTVAIRGTAERITELRINGRPVPVTEDGSFDEIISLSPGLNRIRLDAFDKAGRETTRIIQVFYAPTTGPAIPSPTKDN